MILSKKFIKDYIDLDDNLDIVTIAEDMTKVGNEYDYCGKLVPANKLVIGKIIKCRMHPNSDHLHLCEVDIKNEVLNIICGAPNAREGIKVIVALDGAILPDKIIKRGVIRGYESNGMLCSLAELGIKEKFLTETDILGIHELDENAPLGEDPIKYLGLDDEIIDFELTANRGDLLSYLGLAYELGAIYNKKVKEINTTYSKTKEKLADNFTLNINTDKCSLFLLKKVTNIKIKESPDFIKKRLMACDIRPINNVVDISNYVMLETGQPLHFYDANTLENNITVDMAKDNEVLVTLDKEKRVLSKNDIVIKTNNKIAGLAGVMGGLDTEVTENTTEIMIESAIFEPTLVRKTSKKVTRSEASIRFEKGLDPKRTYLAMERACHLLEKYADGKISEDMLVHDNSNKNDTTINITKNNINDVLGTNISTNEIIEVFERLGFSTIKENDNLLVTIPSRRLDITIKEDLIEEIGRIYGINNIKGKLPILPIKKGTYNKNIRDLKNKLVGLGLNEVLTQIFVNDKEALMFTNNNFEVVKLLDPLSNAKNALRYTLIPSLLKVYNYNKSHNLKNISIFEIAKGFYKKDEEYFEENKLCILMAGKYYEELGNNKDVDFYIIKGIMEEIFDFLGLNNRYNLETENIPKDFHPGMTANIKIEKNTIGIIGRLHPNISNDNIYILELNLDKLKEIRISSLKYKEVNKYPIIQKDMAFILNDNITANEIIKTISKAGGKKITNIEIFDLYKGKGIEEGKKSLAFTLTFEDYTKTLTDEEINVIFEKVIREVEKKYKATLRNC